MRRLLAMTLAALLAFAACGGDDDDSAAAPSTSVADTAPDATTTAAAAPGSATWTYPNLDGQNVTAVESDSTGFTGGVPTPVSIIDGAAGDCAALQTELAFWLSQLDDPDIGERASAYAQYALDVGARNSCDLHGVRSAP